MRTVTALFDSYDHAASAVRAVRDAGIPSADISLVVNTTAGVADEAIDAEESAAAGAGVGVCYGEVSEPFAREKTLVMLAPRVVMITIETIEISTMISAYSTRPCPLPVFTASRCR